MQLYLMQHGACYSKEVDPDQPLSPVGKEQIEASAQAMKKLGLDPEVILSSPKLRARQTARKVAETLDYDPKFIVETQLLKAKTPAMSTIEFFKKFAEYESVFAAGHLPNLNKLASALLCREESVKIGFENGGLLRLDVTSLELGTAVLKYHLLPAHLRAVAGF